MRDLMIDIETLGNRPGGVILSIGAVAFDADTGEIGEEFYAAIDPETSSKVGLTTDISTMLWWMKQSEAAREEAFSGKHSINMALTELSIFVKWQEPSRVWAKPPSFDLVMLEAAFRACDQDIPWHFRVHRDCRTIFDITGTKQPEVGTAHNALDDAKAQALGVIEAYRKLREPSPQPRAKG
ncbi:3'-5' exonuclease [Affinirhizobium rhizoryzae]|uniref:3'-5' exonuclease n=1 Tax=Rhizobium rhizoryzae TaxID=451876 RepID=UPI0013ED4A69|nr:3'-5' exonuclease [Rhizobium rhizoryzae]